MNTSIGHLGAPEVLILLITSLFAVRLLFLRTQNRVSVWIPVVAGLLLFAFWGERFEERAGLPDESIATRPSENLLAEAGEPGIESVANAGEGSSSLRIEETKYGRMLVLPLSADVLNEYLGTKGAAALNNISGVLPPDLRRAYALVPIAGTVGDALPGIKELGRAVTELASQSNGAAEGTAVDKPEWLNDPRDDQIIVKAYDEVGRVLESVLKEQVTETVIDRARASLRQTWDLPDSWQPHREVRLSDDVVLQCVADHYLESIEISTGDTTETMQGISALIEIPESVHQQAVAGLRESVVHQRTWTVGAVTMCLGLAVMLAAGIVQIAGNPGRIIRLVGIPLLLILLLPCVTTSAVLIRNIGLDQTAPLPTSLNLPPFVINGAAIGRPPLPRTVDDAAPDASPAESSEDLAAH